MKYEDEDGIDGPFDRAMARAMAEDARRTQGPVSLTAEPTEVYLPKLARAVKVRVSQQKQPKGWWFLYADVARPTKWYICGMNEGARTEAEAKERGAKWLRAQGVEVE